MRAFKRLFAGVTTSRWPACRRTVILLDMHAMEPLLWTTCSPSPTMSEAIPALCRHGGPLVGLPYRKEAKGLL